MRNFEEIESVAFGDVPKPDNFTLLENEVLIDFCALILRFQKGAVSQEQASAQKQLMRDSYKKACQYLIALGKIGEVMARAEWKLGQMQLDEACEILIKGMGQVSPDVEYKDIIVETVDYFDRRIKGYTDSQNQR